MAVNIQKIRNIARKKGVTSRGAQVAANKQIWQREFQPDYDQVIKRVSSAVFAGLREGAPPPIVS